MAGRRCRKRIVKSLREIERLIGMHVKKVDYEARVAALHGLHHAATIRKLIRRQEDKKGWIVADVEKLDRLVEVHRAISASALKLDALIRYFRKPDAVQGTATGPVSDPFVGPVIANPLADPLADPVTTDLAAVDPLANTVAANPSSDPFVVDLLVDPLADPATAKSLRDIERLIGMHRKKVDYEARVATLHGLHHVATIRKLIRRQEDEKRWIVTGVEELDRLVEVHHAVSASALKLDALIRYFRKPDAVQGTAAGPVSDPFTGPVITNPLVDPLADPVTVDPAAVDPLANTVAANTSSDPFVTDLLADPLADPATTDLVAVGPLVDTVVANPSSDPFVADLLVDLLTDPATADLAAVDPLADTVAANPSSNPFITDPTADLLADLVAADPLPDRAAADPRGDLVADPVADRPDAILACNLVDSAAALRELVIGGKELRDLVLKLAKQLKEVGEVLLNGLEPEEALSVLRSVKKLLLVVSKVSIPAEQFKLM